MNDFAGSLQNGLIWLATFSPTRRGRPLMPMSE
jgi:hypothetical protein